MKRILVIRGGAIGDFVLTLPAIGLLRNRFPGAHLEILGYRQITAMAYQRFYADAIRSIESGPLAAFFSMDSTLPQELIEYFSSFDLILSYLFDPDGIFAANLERCRIKRLITGPSKLSDEEHGAIQLARPLELLDLRLKDHGAKLYPADDDRDFARRFLGTAGDRFVAIHPGSGSEAKNWPIENWKELGGRFLSLGRGLVVASGEADEERARFLESAWKGKPVRFAMHLSLPRLAALFENATFIGHDSGVSHIAGGVGARCFLLFGPTDPAVWAPANENVIVVQAPDRDLRRLTVEKVIETIERAGG